MYSKFYFLVFLGLVLWIPLWITAQSPPPSTNQSPDPTITLLLGDKAKEDNRIVLVIVGDGFTADYQTTYNNLVKSQLMDGVFESPHSNIYAFPFNKYSNFFNIYRVNAISKDLGIRTNEYPNRETALMMSLFGVLSVHKPALNPLLKKVYGNGIDYLIIFGYTYPHKVFAGASHANLATSTDVHLGSVQLHEMGHAIGGLADEYYYGSCNHDPKRVREPIRPNISLESDASKVKWKHWTGYSDVGTYEGASHCSNEIYRNHPSTRMKSGGSPFHPVNTEALILRFYEHVDPIDSVSPATSNTITSDKCETLNFSVDTVLDASDNKIEWFVNKETTARSTDANWSPDSCIDFEKGTHTVKVKVTDDVRYSDNERVIRKDPNRRTQSSRSWTVVVNAEGEEPNFIVTPILDHTLQSYWNVCEGSSTGWFKLTNNSQSRQVTVKRESSADGKVKGYTPPVNQTTDRDILLMSTQGQVTLPSTFTLAKDASAHFFASAASDSDGLNGTVKFTFYVGSRELGAVYFREIDKQVRLRLPKVCNKAPTIIKNILTNQAVDVGSSVSVNVANAFEDPNGDHLTYKVASANTKVATAVASGSTGSTTVTVTGVTKGSTTVTVTATDIGGLSAAQTFTVTVNQDNRPPTSVKKLSNVTMQMGGSGSTVNVSSAFSDPDGNTLTYAATSSAKSKATVSVSGNNVIVTPVAIGSANVTVKATDTGNLSATQTFAVTVNAPPNRPPTSVKQLSNVTIQMGGNGSTVNVSSAFSDPDGNTLTYAATSSAKSKATVSVSGNNVIVTPVAIGSANVTVKATDTGNLSATQTFAVTVNAPPKSFTNICEEIIEYHSSKWVGNGSTVNVSSAFSDPDGNTLMYAATSSAKSKAHSFGFWQAM